MSWINEPVGPSLTRESYDEAFRNLRSTEGRRLQPYRPDPILDPDGYRAALAQGEPSRSRTDGPLFTVE